MFTFTNNQSTISCVRNIYNSTSNFERISRSFKLFSPKDAREFTVAKQFSVGSNPLLDPLTRTFNNSDQQTDRKSKSQREKSSQVLSRTLVNSSSNHHAKPSHDHSETISCNCNWPVSGNNTEKRLFRTLNQGDHQAIPTKPLAAATNQETLVSITRGFASLDLALCADSWGSNSSGNIGGRYDLNDPISCSVDRYQNSLMGLVQSKGNSRGCACTCSPNSGGLPEHLNTSNHFCGHRVYRTTAFSGNPIYSNSSQKRWFSNCPKMSSDNRGSVIFNNRLNKGLCFTMREREQYKIKGLLPAAIRTQEQEAKIAMNYLNSLESTISKYIFMRNLQDRNERLFYRLLCQYTEQLMPIVYTPVVGEACIKYSQIFQPRGLFITIHDAGHIASILNNWPEKDVKAIVVTDGERILGLGDLGANGMGIPVGKLALYTALAGIPPNCLLPVTLDVGTENQQLLNDPDYIGLRQRRVRGPQYDDFIDEFMENVIKKWGRSCLIQFEDFGNLNAFRLLEKYQSSYCTFNDDIQGTASVCVGGIIASCKLTGMKISQHRFLFYGAGEAALGIAELLVSAMEKEGVKTKEARDRIWLLDSKGLITIDRPSGGIDHHKAKFAKKGESLRDMEKIVDLVKPTALIGVAAQPKAFNEVILKKMGTYNKRPLIFPLSNPTSKAECTAEEAYRATEGRCVFASGSPFDPVKIHGKTFHPGQGNNSYIFPGVSLAAIACGVHTIPNEAFLVAARALADQVSQKDLDEGRIYPPLTAIREVSLVIAAKTAQYFYVESLANQRPEPDDKLVFMRTLQYDYAFSGA